MKANVAYEIIRKKLKDMAAVSCYDYGRFYVFKVVPEKYKNSKNLQDTFDGEFSVNKSTGEVKDFKPWFIPLEEYRAGKEVKSFKRVM